MYPLLALCLVTLYPLTRHLLHTYRTIFVFHVVGIAARAEDIFVHSDVVLVFQSVRTHPTFKAALAGVFATDSPVLAYSLQFPTGLVE